MTINPQWGATSETGPARELNEDAVLAAPPLFAVADGMGGHSAGEVASALAIDSLRPLVGRDDIRREEVVEAITAANDAILGWTSADASALGMGTTLSGVCLGEVGGSPHWFVFNVGDSRVYRFADDALQQITIDHSEVEELISAGTLKKADARLHPSRNIVTRSLGTDPAPLVDLWVLPAEAGERFLICSDGLTNEVDDDYIAMILRSSRSPQEAADELIGRALAADARDNISAVVVGSPASAADSGTDVTAPRSRLNWSDRG